MRFCLLAAFVLVAAPVSSTARPDATEGEFFEKRIRPLLVEHCHSCHAAGKGKTKGGLALDSRAGFLKGGDSGAPVVAGDPARSRLIAAVSYTDVGLQMPPKGKLPDAAIADLTEWVRRGAAWPAERATAVSSEAGFDLAKRKAEHWAWQPVRPTAPPAVRDAGWPLDPVDRFLLAKLESAGLRPAPPAERATLLRRATFALTGLPPTPNELAAFLADDRTDAFAAVVDRLLASPRFGEAWGRHWLDLVRYADSRAHEFDYPIPNAYQYRDYVIRALNADVPYDRLVAEHVAGDLLAEPRRHPADGANESVLGTGFWLLGEMGHSPVDLRQDEADRLDNMIDVFSKAFLGMTVACARCHDHKFDAVSAKDYAALVAVLQSSSPRLVRFDSDDQNRAIADRLAEKRERHRPALRQAVAAALRPLAGRLAATLRAAHGGNSAKVPAGWTAEFRAAEADDRHPFHAWAVLATAPDFEGRRQKLRQRWQRPATSQSGTSVVVDYGRLRRGDWLADGAAFRPARVGDPVVGSDPARPVEGIVTAAAAEYDRAWTGLTEAPGSEQETGDLAYARAGRTLRTPSFTLTSSKLFYRVRGRGKVWACVDGHVLMHGPLHRTLVKDIKAGDEFVWVAHDLGRYRGERVHVEFTAAGGGPFAIAQIIQGDQAPPPDPMGERFLRLLDAQTPDDLAAAYQRLAEEAITALADGSLADEPELARVADRLVRLLPPGALPAAEACVKEQAALLAQARKVSRLAPALWEANGVAGRVAIRGNPRAPGEAVPRRFLEALAGRDPLPGDRGGRLELARQVTDPTRNPLLARVAVNRAWQHLFGRGIVASPDNFGVLGEAPSHPELLDALAADFVRDGWSLKRLIRRLMLTRAYAMSSLPNATAEEVDGTNVLLHRFPVRRLPAEAVRDALLAVSGELDAAMFGPPVAPHLTPFLDGRGRPKESGPLDGAGRRSIYLAVRRNFLSPLLLAFDQPPPATTAGRRGTSNVPAQALALMNDPFVHQQAKRWAERTAGEPPRERAAGMLRRAFGREPAAGEIETCVRFVEEQATRRGGADEVLAWADLAHALVNVKEFVFIH